MGLELSKEDVLRLASLAKLRLSNEEVLRYQKELSIILSYVEQLAEVDTTGVEPTYQVTGLKNVFRKDEVREQLASPQTLLACAPQSEGSYIKVGRMI